MLENVPNMFNVTKSKMKEDLNKPNDIQLNGKITENKVDLNISDKNNKRKRVEIYDKIITLLNELKTMDLE